MWPHGDYPLIRVGRLVTARDHLASNVVGHLQGGVSAPVLERAVAYWRAVDKNLGDKIAAGVGVA